jgi:hypothetical protein
VISALRNEELIDYVLTTRKRRSNLETLLAERLKEAIEVNWKEFDKRVLATFEEADDGSNARRKSEEQRKENA